MLACRRYSVYCLEIMLPLLVNSAGKGHIKMKIRWGILSTANIGVEKVIPAMQKGVHCRIDAIASRSGQKARAAAESLAIPKAYDSYDQLLQDPEIDAVYIPLPNNLHVDWAIHALEAGKHVLCEKPIACDVDGVTRLQEASGRYPELKIMEAFMYRFHPQWEMARKLVATGRIGKLCAIQSFFSYFNDDPDNIRNSLVMGGGGLRDIGCYCVSMSRFLTGAEPGRVCGLIRQDPQFQTDRLASGILDFGECVSTFTCSTQLTDYQRVLIFGDKGRIEIEIPFNAPPDKPTRIWHQSVDQTDEIVLEVCDQYTLQGDRFAEAVLKEKPVPTPLADAMANMCVLGALFDSSQKGGWVALTGAPDSL